MNLVSKQRGLRDFLYSPEDFNAWNDFINHYVIILFKTAVTLGGSFAFRQVARVLIGSRHVA